MPDIYFRNPEPYIGEACDADIRLFSWDTGDFVRRNIDPLKFMAIYLGHSRPWKLLTIAIEGASEYNESSRSLNEPVAVYPTWRFEYGYQQLRDYCENPVGDDMRLYGTERLEPRFRPVHGQPHKVLIYDSPDMSSAVGQNYFRHLRAIKADYPDVEFIIHNTASYRVIFGVEFDAACYDPHMSAKMGSVVLPSGRNIKAYEMGEYRPWIRILGYTAKLLQSAKTHRVAYNIESIRWAQENYKKNVNFRVAVMEDIDLESPGADYEVQKATNNFLTKPRPKGSIGLPGDGVICDACSLANDCKYYREGAVCSVPGSDSAELAKMFGTREASTIIDGLVRLTELQAKRVALDLEEEEELDERLPQTDKRIKDLFDSGVKVAKLIDPNLNGKGTTVNVGVVGGAAMVAQQTPQELMSSAVRALEQRGLSRDEITPEMIGGLLESVQDRKHLERVIEGEVIDG